MEHGKSGLEECDLLQVRMYKNRQRYNILRKGGVTSRYAIRDVSAVYEKISPTLRCVRGANTCLKALAMADLQVQYTQRRVVRPILVQLYQILPNNEESWIFVVRMWKAITNLVINSGNQDLATTVWKQACLHWKCTILGYEGKIPEYPHILPLAPSCVLTRCESYADYQLFTTAISTRSLPSPSGEKIKMELLKAEERYTTTQGEVDFDSLQEINKFAALSGREIYNCFDHRQGRRALAAHVSFSNSACLESSRSEGGKRSFLNKIFVQEFLNEVPEAEEKVLTPMGNIIIFKAGEARFRAEIPGTQIPSMGIFGQEDHSTFFPTYVGLEEDRVSQLLWVWSVMDLAKKGFIHPTSGLPTGKFLDAEFSAIGEPGGKVRIVTKTYCSLIIYLEPYAHVLNSILSSDPTLRDGLGAAHQAFQYFRRFKNLEKLSEKIMTGDLETATDMVEFQVGCEVMSGFWHGFSRNKGLTPYFLNSHRLILQPLNITSRGRTIQSVRGSPMGFPGTKALLHILNKVVEVRCTGLSGYRLPRTISELEHTRYSCAGDDFVREDTKVELLRQFRPGYELLRLKMSEEKSGIFSVGAMFCESILLVDGKRQHPPSKMEDVDGIYFLVDAARGRLMSPESKDAHGDKDSNPLWGKVAQLSREIAWMVEPYKGYKKKLSVLIEFAFRDFGKIGWMLGIPPKMGGFGLYSPTPEELLQLLPKQFKQAVNGLVQTGDEETFERVLNSFKEPLVLVRGEPKVVQNWDFLFDTISIYGVEEESLWHLIPDNVGTLTRFRKRNALKKLGWIDLNEFVKRGPFQKPAWLSPTKPERGWATAPLEMRFKTLETHYSNFSEDLPLDDLVEVLQRLQSHDFGSGKHLFVDADSAFLIEGSSGELEGIFSRSQANDSLSFKLPNDSTLFLKEETRRIEGEDERPHKRARV